MELTSTPVLELALTPQAQLSQKLTALLQDKKLDQLAYLPLKIAMDIQDKPATSKYAKLRFTKFTQLIFDIFETCHPHLDIWVVFFAKGNSKLVSP